MVFNNWCYNVIFLPTPVAYLDHSSFWKTLDIRVGCEKVKVWNVKTFNHVTAPISWGWDGVKKQTPTEWLAGCVHILHFFHCCKLLILGLHCLWDFKELWIHLECPPQPRCIRPNFCICLSDNVAPPAASHQHCCFSMEQDALMENRNSQWHKFP